MMNLGLKTPNSFVVRCLGMLYTAASRGQRREVVADV